MPALHSYWIAIHVTAAITASGALIVGATKETWSFITWVGYAAYLHARATAGWRGRKAAWIQLAAFTALMFNPIGVNMWITGLHSYAGISGGTAAPSDLGAAGAGCPWSVGPRTRTGVRYRLGCSFRRG